MNKIIRTWSLMRESWEVLKQDKSLLVFPLISGICCLLLLASFAVPLYTTGHWMPPARDAAPAHQIAYYGTLFAFYAANYFIVVFFNAAIVACAAIRLGGGQPTIGDGLRAAVARLPVIAGWALVSATVGLILRAIEDRSDKFGEVIAGLLGTAWTLMTFLVVPILVIENKSPFSAIGDSTSLLKKTWGEQLVNNFSFGGIFFFLALPGVALLIGGFYLGHGLPMLICTVVAVVYFIALALINSTLHAIFQTALYLYVRDGQVPAGFRPGVLENAMS